MAKKKKKRWQEYIGAFSMAHSDWCFRKSHAYGKDCASCIDPHHTCTNKQTHTYTIHGGKVCMYADIWTPCRTSFKGQAQQLTQRLRMVCSAVTQHQTKTKDHNEWKQWANYGDDMTACRDSGSALTASVGPKQWPAVIWNSRTEAHLRICY